MNILQACQDPRLFGPWFRNPRTWAAWFAFLAALFGLGLEGQALATYHECTSRREPREGGHREAWLVCGRRAGKSFMLALIAVFLATFFEWRSYLAPGERGTVMVIAADRKQARVILRYVKALLGRVPMLSRLVENETLESVELSNGIVIEVHSANFRTTRGYTIVAALADEIAFWRSDDSANPDSEILAALRPAMATVPGAMLLCASSPYAKRGALYRAFRDHFGQDGPVLVWHAPTRRMNPEVPQGVIDEAYEADEASARAEYGAEFRSDIESFVSREIVESCIVPGESQLGPSLRHHYRAFVDPSGGANDSMTIAVGHRDEGRLIVDLTREAKPPFNPDTVVQDFARVLKAYRLHAVTGDRYAGEWPRSRFAAHGVRYEVAALPRSELYRDLLPMLTGGSIQLPDNPKLILQLCGLERRTSRAGRDVIDHAPGAHDDLANAVAGLASVVATATTARSTEFRI